MYRDFEASSQMFQRLSIDVGFEPTSSCLHAHKQRRVSSASERVGKIVLKICPLTPGFLDPEIDDFWIEAVNGRILDFPRSKSGLDAAVGM